MKPLLIIAAFLAATVVLADAEPRDFGFEGYTARLWEAQDGLPEQTAQAFAQTNDGSLWIGTKGGLLRFDGARFVVYDREIAPAMLERGVNCLLAARDGSLWIGTEGGGLVRYWNNRFQSYPSADGSADEFIRAIYKDSEGTIWVGADQGLFRVTGLTISRVDGSHGIPSVFVRAILEDGRGHIWVGGTALLEFNGKSFMREHPLPGGTSTNLITAMYVARDGAVWVGTLSGLHRLTASGRLKRFAGMTAEVSVITQTSDEALWVGTIGQGLFNLRQAHLLHISSANLPSKTVNAVLEDREHNVWLGTQAGIVRLSKTPVTIVGFAGGADSQFETLTDDGRGTIWVAASTHLFRIQNEVATPYAFPGLPDLRVRTLLRDERGGFWLGTDGQGLLHVDGRHVERFSVGHGLVNDFVRAILISRDGSLWVGTDGGVTHLDGEHSRSYTVDTGLAYFSVTALFQDRNGDIWVGTSRGLSHFSRGRLVQDAVTRELRQDQLWSICEDSSGELWFATSDGLYGFKARNLIHFTTAQGLVSNTIYAILVDSKGNMWLGNPNSISRLQLSELDNFHFGSRVSLTFYEDSADLESATLYSGLQPEGAVSPNGDVWFPGNKGAIHIAASKIVPAPASPISIDEVTADEQQQPLASRIVLKPENTRLEISYAVIHLGSQQGFRFRYKMGGLESWNEALTRRTAYYTHLPPGKYRFIVQAYEIGNPGAVSEASIFIVQEPRFYLTSWFLACCVLVSLDAIFVVYRLRLRQIRTRLQMINEERTRLAREMHDTVIQGCAGVSSLLEAALGVEASEEPLRDQILSYASDQVRATIDSAREAVWALRSTSASDADVAARCQELARHFQGASGVPIRFQVTGDPFQFGELTTREFMMAVREALTNAVSHAHPTCIDLDLCFEKRDLKVEIRDDGCGFQPPPDSSRNGHYGIQGMRERVRLLRGVLSIESKPRMGTTVRIVIPRKQRTIHWIGASNVNNRNGED